MTARPPTREELRAAARQEAAAGNPGLASLLADEADYAPNGPSDNARVARDFPGGLRRTED
jgi:hypothetical protein